jgi:hypothetical protein
VRVIGLEVQLEAARLGGELTERVERDGEAEREDFGLLDRGERRGGVQSSTFFSEWF